MSASTLKLLSRSSWLSVRNNKPFSFGGPCLEHTEVAGISQMGDQFRIDIHIITQMGQMG